MTAQAQSSGQASIALVATLPALLLAAALLVQVGLVGYSALATGHAARAAARADHLGAPSKERRAAAEAAIPAALTRSLELERRRGRLRARLRAPRLLPLLPPIRVDAAARLDPLPQPTPPGAASGRGGLGGR